MCALEKQSITDTDLPDDTATRFSIIELAKYLGVTKSTIFRYKKNRVFPFHQVGRRIYFKKSDVDRALLSNKKNV
ncbi:MAG: DNA-binding protein [Pedobacter sp.]|nr:MAG: DNA-binding protein [Pedobacter sp.]